MDTGDKSNMMTFLNKSTKTSKVFPPLIRVNVIRMCATYTEQKPITTNYISGTYNQTYTRHIVRKNEDTAVEKCPVCVALLIKMLFYEARINNKKIQNLVLFLSSH